MSMATVIPLEIPRRGALAAYLVMSARTRLSLMTIKVDLLGLSE